jgi:hypothetical protein
MKNLAQTPTQLQVDADGYAVGQADISQDPGQRLPNIYDHAAPFLLGHSPKSWELVEMEAGKWELLPVLKPLFLVPGTQLVEAAKSPGSPIDSTRARARWEDMGFTVLKDSTEYRTTVPSATGPAYFLRWERIKPYPDGDWEMHLDQQGWNEWRRSLVADGRLAPPRGAVVSQLRQRLQRQITRAEPHAHLPKAVRAQEQARAMLAGLDAATAPKPVKAEKPRKEAANVG